MCRTCKRARPKADRPSRDAARARKRRDKRHERGLRPTMGKAKKPFTPGGARAPDVQQGLNHGSARPGRGALVGSPETFRAFGAVRVELRAARGRMEGWIEARRPLALAAPPAMAPPSLARQACAPQARRSATRDDATSRPTKPRST